MHDYREPTDFRGDRRTGPDAPPESFEAICATCGDQFEAPGDEDPADTLCVACAEEEQES